MSKIAAVGDNCVDVYGGDGNAYPGGNPVNVAVYARRLGALTSYTGAVGTDQYGQMLLDALSSKGVDVSRVKVIKGNTAVTQVELIDGERVFGDYDEGVMADFNLDATDIDFICCHDLLISGIWGHIETRLGEIRSRGIPVAFDFATKLDSPEAAAALPHVDYAFFSDDRPDETNLRQIMADTLSQGPRLVIATRGELGSLCFDGADFSDMGIVPCEVIDTMGAGDSYIAGFICGLLQGASVHDCMSMGAVNASETIGYRGAW